MPSIYFLKASKKTNYNIVFSSLASELQRKSDVNIYTQHTQTHTPSEAFN